MTTSRTSVVIVDDDYVRIHIGSDSHLIRETMIALEARLDPDVFFRIHRSQMVNIEKVKELQPWLP